MIKSKNGKVLIKGSSIRVAGEFIDLFNSGAIEKAVQDLQIAALGGGSNEIVDKQYREICFSILKCCDEVKTKLEVLHQEGLY